MANTQYRYFYPVHEEKKKKTHTLFRKTKAKTHLK